MREPAKKTLLLWSTLVIALALLSAGVAVAAPPVKEVKVGTDCWQTQDGTEQTIATIPANFFCRGSKAMPKAHIEFKGKPEDQPPGSFKFKNGVPVTKLGGMFANGFCAVLADGRPEKFSREIPAWKIHALITHNGGEVFNLVD